MRPGDRARWAGQRPPGKWSRDGSMGAGPGASSWGTHPLGTRVRILLKLWTELGSKGPTPGLRAPSNWAGVQLDSWALRMAAGPKLAR